MNETDKTLALRVLRETLHDPEAKPPDRLRAAQLLLEHDAPAAGGQAALHDATDGELMIIAKGGMPRIEGPAGTSKAAVPSAATVERPALTPSRVERAVFGPGPLELGPKGTRDTPTVSSTPGAPAKKLERGPKEDPWAKKPRAAPKTESAIDRQIKFDDTPAQPAPEPEPEPEPWE